MANTNLQKIVTTILNNLTPKQKEVVTKRFGLKNGHRMTLESIGKEYGITRERVRQIEEDALNNLRKPSLISQVSEFLTTISKHIDSHGGIKKEEHLLEKEVKTIFAGQKFSGSPKAIIHLLLTLGESFERHPETKDCHSFWSTNKETAGHAKAITASLNEKLKNYKQPVEKEDLLNFAMEFAQAKNAPTSEAALMSYVDISKNINSNVFGQYGLAHWPNINPRGMKDKAFLVLNKIKKPLHFTQVAKEIERSGLAKKSAHPQTVHNELIKDNRFVLVGRGMYALADWGFVPGTIKDVIVKTLGRSKNPLSKEEIISAVLAQRQVKANTILLNLQNNKNFKKTGDGKYILA